MLGGGIISRKMTQASAQSSRMMLALRKGKLIRSYATNFCNRRYSAYHSYKSLPSFRSHRRRIRALGQWEAKGDGLHGMHMCKPDSDSEFHQEPGYTEVAVSELVSSNCELQPKSQCVIVPATCTL